jgi:hypothetical protein
MTGYWKWLTKKVSNIRKGVKEGLKILLNNKLREDEKFLFLGGTLALLDIFLILNSAQVALTYIEGIFLAISILLIGFFAITTVAYSFFLTEELGGEESE